MSPGVQGKITGWSKKSHDLKTYPPQGITLSSPIPEGPGQSQHADPREQGEGITWLRTLFTCLLGRKAWHVGSSTGLGWKPSADPLPDQVNLGK